VIVVVFVVALAAAVRLPTLNQPPLEAHGFRQTQTAYTATEFHAHGIDVLHPRLPVLGEPFEVPFEFPLYQAIAQVPMAAGLTPVEALRGTDLAFFLLTGLLLWILVRQLASPLAGVLALVAFVAAPFGLLWGRAAMIEYLATAASLGLVLAVMRWRDTRRWPWALVAIFAGSVALLVKVTTGVLWILPALAYAAPTSGAGLRGWIRAHFSPVMLAIIGAPVGAALAWTRHADRIKGAHHATAWLTSRELQTWNFGTLRQRLSLHSWLLVADRIQHYLSLLPWWLFPLLLLPALRLPQRNIWIAIGLVTVLGPAIFFNLYVVHDYYLAAVSPAVAAVLGLGVTTALESRYRLVAGAAVFAVAVLSLLAVRSYWGAAYRTINVAHAFPAVPELRANTTPDDLIVVEGYDWSPEILFEAQRRGQMLPERIATRSFVTGLARHGYRFVVSPSLSDDAIALLLTSPWNGSLGKQLRVMAEDEHGLRSAHVATTDDPRAAEQSGLPRLVQEPFAIACDAAPSVLPSGAVTWVTFDGPPADTTVTVAGYGALPARRALRVTSADRRVGRSLRVSCHGSATLTVTAVRGG
jgi:hypothetical protein